MFRKVRLRLRTHLFVRQRHEWEGACRQDDDGLPELRLRRRPTPLFVGTPSDAPRPYVDLTGRVACQFYQLPGAIPHKFQMPSTK